MEILTDSRNELLDYLQENGVSLEIIKKVSKELEKQDTKFIKRILNEVEKILNENEEAYPRYRFLELKQIIQQNSGFEE